MRRFGVLAALGFLIACPGIARQQETICGTRREKWKEDLFLHRQALKARALAHRGRTMAAAGASRVYAAQPDTGNIAVIDDSDGVVARVNEFDLDNATLAFVPASANAGSYQVLHALNNTYDAAAAASGSLLALADDDSAAVALPFAFPFFGTSHRSAYVNSDGNLTFTQGDNASTDRSLGRMTAGPPRISPLFEDLNPAQSSKGVRVLSDAQRVVVSWEHVPEYSDFGTGQVETFQLRLYPDGRIEFAYNGINSTGAVVGIAPGNLLGSSSVVDFSTGANGSYASTVAERFGGTPEVDIATAAQKFYQTHEDDYDYLVFYNNESIAAGSSAVSWESTVRNNRSGYGDLPIDIGQQYGSRGRLQAVLNMGPLQQYQNTDGTPFDPNHILPLRDTAQDTPTTVLAHEAGHLFLAYASIRDDNDANARPMLGFQNAHWYFGFNSDASLLEGNRIQDNGAGATPRFQTIAVTEWFSPLDQYLMGLRAPEEVTPPDSMFLVNGLSSSYRFGQPEAGVGLNGTRQDIRIGDIINAEGRRTPDVTVSQKRFRFAFILIVEAGKPPSAAEIAQVDSYRTSFEAFYAQAASQRAVADTRLKRSLALSVFPAAGVLAGGTAPALLTVESAPASDLTVALAARNGNAAVPATVTIKAGSKAVPFTIRAVQPGVEALAATPSDPGYDSAEANIQVAPALAVALAPVSGDNQVSTSTGPLASLIVVRVGDVNNLPYPGLSVRATAGSGTVTPAVAVTDANGQAAFAWNTGTAQPAQLNLALEGVAGAAPLTIHAVSGIVTAAAAVNAASGARALAPGTLATIFGDNLSGGQNAAVAGTSWPTILAGVRVLVNGTAAPLLFVSDQQINFLLPPDLSEGNATLSVVNARGSGTLTVAVNALAPGTFVLDPASQAGAVLIAGTGQTTAVHPARAGDYLEIYATGLGAVQKDSASGLMWTVENPAVTIGGVAAKVVYSGLVPGYTGLYQINAQVPAGLAAGIQPLAVTIGGVAGNIVNIGVQ